MPRFKTLLFEIDDGIAQITLNRPEVLNAFDELMQDEFVAIWRLVRHDESIRVIVLTGAGNTAFCVGIDRNDIPVDEEYDPFTYDDPGRKLGPKSQGVWKPVIAAVNGMACGGAFYFLGESDIIIAAEHATFFDPHVTYGMTASYEPILLGTRVGFGEVLRMTLLGAGERLSAASARQAGLVTEVVEGTELITTAYELARIVAAHPPTSVQATLRTLWAGRNLTPDQATALGNVFLQLGTSSRASKEGQESFSRGDRPTWRVR
jgi:enoyl-CoA hydratase/carnithine racemase